MVAARVRSDSLCKTKDRSCNVMLHHDSKLFRPAIGCRRKEATIRPDERLKACRTLLGTWFEKGATRMMTDCSLDLEMHR